MYLLKLTKVELCLAAESSQTRSLQLLPQVKAISPRDLKYLPPLAKVALYLAAELSQTKGLRLPPMLQVQFPRHMSSLVALKVSDSC